MEHASQETLNQVIPTTFGEMPLRKVTIWTWNGYNAQWIEGFESGAAMQQRIEEFKAKHSDHDVEITIRNGVVVLRGSYEFYGSRDEWLILVVGGIEIIPLEGDDYTWALL